MFLSPQGKMVNIGQKVFAKQTQFVPHNQFGKTNSQKPIKKDNLFILGNKGDE